MKKIFFICIILVSSLWSASCVQYERVFVDRTIIATGTWKNAQEAIALDIATTMALNSIAKQAGDVLQSEDTTLYNDKVHMIITTKANNIIRGYTVLSKEWDPKTHRAEVTIKIDGKVLANDFCRVIKIY